MTTAFETDVFHTSAGGLGITFIGHGSLRMKFNVAFLPMHLPYTMTPAMVAEAARAFRPRILYPYHFVNYGYLNNRGIAQRGR